MKGAGTIAKFKKPLLFALSLLPIAVLAGIFVGRYQLDLYPAELIEELIAQLGSTELLIVIGAVQTVGYAFICGFAGYMLADKLGLWKPVRFEQKPLLSTLVISAVGGIILSLDYFTFGAVIDGIRESTAAGLTASGVIASVLYGGIIEEVMLRLFFLSLIALVIWKVFYRNCDSAHIPQRVFIAANIVAAVVFAAGHLPAIYATFGGLTPLLLIRCFLFNGGFGLVFGRLYRKYGIIYAMAGHTLFHIVSKIVWFLFI